MSDPRAIAAQNNAELCDAVCRAHGLFGAFDAGVWACRSRTPTFYPDAVTLEPAATEDLVLARIDNAAGASIKDSFAVLDLSSLGYDVLFDATWYAGRVTTTEQHDGWSVVNAPDAFDRWVNGWRGADGPADVWNPGVLAEHALVFVALERQDELVAGALLNRGDRVVGISNVFAAGCRREQAWSGAVALASQLFADADIVGYGDETELALATAAGLTSIGPLRVWIR
jgi:hypothetical protein